MLYSNVSLQVPSFLQDYVQLLTGPISPDLLNLSIIEALKGLENGQYTSEELVLAHLSRIDEVNDQVHAILRINPGAIQEAKAADAIRRSGAKLGKLHGIPILIKDNIAVKGMPTTAGSLALASAHFPTHATVVQKLLDQGAIILAKTGLSEWSNYRSNESSNGWNPITGQCFGGFHECQDPSGSSSGSSVGTSLGLGIASLGSETDGSIIMPAEINNVVGLKPTVGRTSRFGVIPISDTQDTIGPITKTVQDAALMLECISGPDSRDPKTRHPKGTTDFSKFVSRGSDERKRLDGVRIGVPRNMFMHDAPDFVISSLTQLITTLQTTSGARVVDVNVDGYSEKAITEAEKTVLSMEFKPCLEKYLSQSDSDMKTLEQIIAFTESEEREELGRRDIALFKDSVTLNSLHPIKDDNDDGESRKWRDEAGQTSFRNGLKIDTTLDDGNLDVLMVPAVYASGLAAVSGHPILTIPLSFSPGHTKVEWNALKTTVKSGPGIPFGVAIVGRKWEEDKLIRIGGEIERVTRVRAEKSRGRLLVMPVTQLMDVKMNR